MEQKEKGRSLRDLYWIAGLIEGEGSFVIHNHLTGTKSFQFTMGMTDKDTINKASRILKGNPNGYFEGTRNSPTHKRIYRIKMSGVQAIGWMMTLYPLMSQRRQEKIKEIIGLWKRTCGHRPDLSAFSNSFYSIK